MPNHPSIYAPVAATKLRDAILDMVDRFGASEGRFAYATARNDTADAVRCSRAANRQYKCIIRLSRALLAMTVTEVKS